MTIDYFSISPKTQISYMDHPQICVQKQKMKGKVANQELIEQLHSYKFPRSTTNTTASFATPETQHPDFKISPIQHRRKSSTSSIFTFRANNRRFSHRRSAAVSGTSSNESIFSSDLQPSSSISTPPSTRTATNLPSIVNESPLASPITPIRLEFDDDQGELQMPKKPLLLPTEPSQHMIDLDIASKSHQPRLGSPMPCLDVDTTAGNFHKSTIQNINHHGDGEDDESDEGEESISIVDFLRESMSERAMCVSADYDPFQYIHLNRGMWIEESRRFANNNNMKE